MQDLIENIDKILLQSYVSRTSFFQLNFFIINKEPTTQAKLKRCADELMVRKQSIQAALLELDEINDVIELMGYKLKKIDSSSPVGKIKIRRLRRRIDSHKQRIIDVEERLRNFKEEAKFFVEAHNQFSKIQQPKSWDDLEVQMEYWNAKLGNDIQRRLLLQMPIDIETINTVLALPDDAPIKKEITQVMHQQSKRIGEAGKKLEDKGE